MDSHKPHPTSELSRLSTSKIIKNPVKEIFNNGNVEGWQVGGGPNSFPTEYAVSGWFKWTPLQ